MREAGFLNEIKKNDEIKVYENQFAGDTADKAQTLMSNMLAAHPGINAVFGSNESTTVGALGALEQAKKLGKIKFVGFDSSAELVAALDKGDIQALVLQDPVKMGYLSVKAAAAALRGKSPPKNNRSPRRWSRRRTRISLRFSNCFGPRLTKVPI